MVGGESGQHMGETVRENEMALGEKQSKKALQDKMRTLGEACIYIVERENRSESFEKNLEKRAS